MDVLGRIFLNSRKEGREDGKSEFFSVRCRRTYVPKKNTGKRNLFSSEIRAITDLEDDRFSVYNSGASCCWTSSGRSCSIKGHSSKMEDGKKHQRFTFWRQIIYVNFKIKDESECCEFFFRRIIFVCILFRKLKGVKCKVSWLFREFML